MRQVGNRGYKSKKKGGGTLRFAQLIVMLAGGRGRGLKMWGWNTAAMREVNTYISLRLGKCDKAERFNAEN